MRIVVAGEAVIDFTSAGDLAFQGHFGGAPLNASLAAARLGQPTGLVTQLSTDMFGRRLMDYLQANGIDTRFVCFDDAPTTLAFAEKVGTSNRYAFYTKGSADSRYAPDTLPDLPDSVAFIQFGSIALLNEPAAGSILSLVRRNKERKVVVLDPNVRPSLIADPAAYRRDFAEWCGLADLLKISDEDAAFLDPQGSPDHFTARWLASGVKAVVITAGGDGATLYRAGAIPVAIPAPAVTVVDTIGAGDTFSAALMVALLERGVATADGLAHLDEEAWRDSLVFAAAAAAINCTRPGAQPPTRDEVAAFLKVLR
jgi:fructokinase